MLQTHDIERQQRCDVAPAAIEFYITVYLSMVRVSRVLLSSDKSKIRRYFVRFLLLFLWFVDDRRPWPICKSSSQSITKLVPSPVQAMAHDYSPMIQ